MDSLPPWPIVLEILRTLVLPAFVAAALVLYCGRLARRMVWLQRVLPALALTAGLAAGNYFRKLLEWSPDGRGWPVLLPATVVGLAGILLAELLSGKLRIGLSILTCTACGWWLAEAWPPFTLLSVGMTLVAVMILICAALWPDGLRAAPPVPSFLLDGLILAWGTAAATVLIFAHSARFSDLAVLMTASYFAVALVGFLSKTDHSSIRIGPAVFLPALMLAGAANTFSDVPTAAFVLIALAPLGLLLMLLPLCKKLSLPARLTFTAATMLIPCALGVYLAVRNESLSYGE
jgi:hypothetical protein